MDKTIIFINGLPGVGKSTYLKRKYGKKDNIILEPITQNDIDEYLLDIKNNGLKFQLKILDNKIKLIEKQILLKQNIICVERNWYCDEVFAKMRLNRIDYINYKLKQQVLLLSINNLIDTYQYKIKNIYIKKDITVCLIIFN